MTPNQNPFQHVHVDPTGEEMLVAAMPADILLDNLDYYLFRKPKHDLEMMADNILGDYADADIDPDLALTLGMKLPTDEERKRAENTMIQNKGNVHLEAIRNALPFILVGLTRDDTYEQAREMVQDFTKLRDQVQVKSKFRNVIELLLPPVIADYLDGDDEGDDN